MKTMTPERRAFIRGRASDPPNSIVSEAAVVIELLEALEAAEALLSCGHPNQCAAEGECIVCAMLKLVERIDAAYAEKLKAAEALARAGEKDTARLDYLMGAGATPRAAIDAAIAAEAEALKP